MREIRVFPDLESLAEGFTELMFGALRRRPEGRPALLALAGGRTPRPCYRLLARRIAESGMAQDGILWLAGDERWVPPSHGDSNERMIRETILDPAGVRPDAFLSWHAGAGDPAAAADRLAAAVVKALEGRSPQIAVLGIGADGHTASLFPGSVVLLPGGAWRPIAADMPAIAAAVQPGGPHGPRLTLCPRFLNSAQWIIFLVSGAEKRDAVKAVLAGKPSAPASWIGAETGILFATEDALEPSRPNWRGEARFAAHGASDAAHGASEKGWKG